ncbi:mitochondrial ribosomal RNA large subunit methyltransferase MRM2 [Andalucia godoyi]|uniref:rRNA methyltransferase 2, mitochondrial n=1 Tax=Andalucia godoyi TaxID=505711 RepID=A0A8K0AGP0_ANDGO|nr:mitochondrial ribosomal RNA large subunit methyltransferase MRM2 [Andalucia godoyi]|eukprot:ANDGO_03488.mRNA.1 mitochondrial ribosomal RNA large subunit methyltransferase MRM2
MMFMLQRLRLERHFSSGGPSKRVKVSAILGKSPSSTNWLRRQFSDPYVRLAQIQEMRSRSSFKLLQIDERSEFLTPGKRVIDLGSAPGGWSLVAAQKVNAVSSPLPSLMMAGHEKQLDEALRKQTKESRGHLARSLVAKRPVESRGLVISVDLQDIEPIEGVTFIKGNFLDALVQKQIRYHLDGREVDVVLSDMSPKTSGNSSMDHLRIMALAHAALGFAEEVLRPGGVFLCKIFQGAEEIILNKRLNENFLVVKHAKPQASREQSPEVYLLAQGFVPKYLQSDVPRDDPILEEEARQRMDDLVASIDADDHSKSVT